MYDVHVHVTFEVITDIHVLQRCSAKKRGLHHSFTLAYKEGWTYSHMVTKTKFPHTDGLPYFLINGAAMSYAAVNSKLKHPPTKPKPWHLIIFCTQGEENSMCKALLEICQFEQYLCLIKQE